MRGLTKVEILTLVGCMAVLTALTCPHALCQLLCQKVPE
jgi:hypothetical protein